MIRARTVLGAMVVVAVAAAGCGDDDDSASGNEAYCDLAQEMDDQEAFPTPEQLERLRDTAPDEIADEVDTAVKILLPVLDTDDPEAAFDDPELVAAIEVIDDYEAEECGLPADGGEGDEAAVEIDPELADYCAIAQVINDQDEFPTPDQLEELRANAPDELAEEADLIVDAFLAAGDDPFSAFEVPGVDEAFEVIEPFDAEHCGIDNEDTEEEQDPSVTELDPAATRVDVTATDYAFELGTAPTAGRTSFVMTNSGAERHVMLLFRKAPGATTDAILESGGEEGVEEEWESDTAAAGEEAVLTTDLEPGDYGMVCYIPDAEGQPHFMLGMTEEFTVS